MYRFAPIKSDDKKQYAMLDGYGEIPDHVGPFRRNGEVYYYSIERGEYYDPKKDLYTIKEF
jgi:hypothetical protein